MSTIGILLTVIMNMCSLFPSPTLQHCCLSVCHKTPEYKIYLTTKRVIQPSHTTRSLLLKYTEKEWGHYIISHHWLSNLLSFFLRKAFIFLGCDSTATGQQLAETAEKFSEIFRTLTNTQPQALTHRKALNPFKYDFKASST